MVTRSPNAFAHDGMTPLERELALASFGPAAAHDPADDATPHAASAAADAAPRAPHNPHLAH
ncbi:TPA: flagellum-specific ATP synthase FliI, partial [Burkholderia cenocepacia]